VARGGESQRTLIERAQDSFPELTQTTHARLPERVALRVRPPEAEGGALKLETRGFTFQVRPQGAGAGSRALRSADRATYGSQRLLSAGGKHGEAGGAWLAHQARDFLLLEGGQVHRERYEVSLPEGVVALKDAGEALDFLDAKGQPVLRFHYPEARDAAGRSFPSQVRLLGAIPAPSAEGRLAVASRVLTLEVSVDLEEVRGQALIVYVWSSTAFMPTDRASHLMAKLPGGKVLAFGGFSRSGNRSTDLNSAVVYDVASMTWSFTGAMSTTRPGAAAVALPDGRVLVTGGTSGSSSLSTAELYDPALGTWSAAAPMSQGRYNHTATLLPDGRVLVVGGWGSTAVGGAELYNPASNTWTATASLSHARYWHTATLLKDGKVLVAGGYGQSSGTLGPAELYDPAKGTWSSVMPSSARGHHTATLLEDGRVLLAGGQSLNGEPQLTCQLFDPSTGTWSSTGSLMDVYTEHAAVRLPNGRVLVVSGTRGHGEAQEYNPITGTWSSAGTLTTGPGANRAALLLDTGSVLVTGGNYGFGTLSSAELYGPIEVGWEPTGSLLSARSDFTLTLLPDGRALALGGSTGNFSSVSQDLVEVYDPSAGTWERRQSMPAGRSNHSATLLADGRILVAGGSTGSGAVNTAWLHEPTTGSWNNTGSLNQARVSHSATVLEDGRVLIAGGGGVSSAELYDPATGTFQPTGALGSSRFGHVAVRLPNGKVLLAGGYSSDPLATAELYDPATGTFQPTGSMSVPRYNLAGTLLRTGKVLVTGGSNGSAQHATAELYDPATGTFQPTGSMALSRSGHGLVVLETGNVLVVGGGSGGSTTATSELYDVSRGTFRSLGRMKQARARFPLVLLRTGKVLVAGGFSESAELGPLNSVPVAHEVSVTAREDEQVVVTLSGTDGDGEGLRYELVRPPAHGSLSGQVPDLTYVPAAGYNGGDSFTFRVSDGMRFSDEATVSLTVAPVNDAPTTQGGWTTTAEDTPVTVALSGEDVDGDPLTYTVVAGPSQGTLSGTSSQLVYTPAANASGTYTFTFRVSDGKGGSAEATFSITVTPVNDAPVARSSRVTTAQGRAVELSLGATDAEWSALTYTVVSGPAHGTLTGTPPRMTYTPEPGFVGKDSFTFTVRDGESAQSGAATVSLTVTALPGADSGAGGCTATGGGWPLGSLALLLLGARRSRGHRRGGRGLRGQ
jgi:N-acetylneuraminic acid mutarotase